jgi:cell division protease FtsH
MPRGVLLVGPPGTGKTLIARAVAGEAKAPFFSLSGSEFVEMFVGVGAARVRDLFQQAKDSAPCIIFIDELDAVGRHRGAGLGGGHDEREQTLNQLLVEMDGFDPSTGVILLAATNRPDVLDPALLRPGRFDRQVVIDAPDNKGRLAILQVHARGKPIDPAMDLTLIAGATPGFTGADLANVLNEAALLAARKALTQITKTEIDEAVERAIAGPERKSRRLGEEERRRVAFHEAGHALVAALSKHADPVRKISIIPRGHAALGFTMQFPTDDRYLITRSALLDQLKSLLAGRAAEQMVFSDLSTGAQNDLSRTSDLARRMVCRFGMSDRLGPVAFGREDHQVFLGRDLAHEEKNYSESTAQEIDQEVRRIIEESNTAATDIIRTHRTCLDRIAETLLEREVLQGSELDEILRKELGEELIPKERGKPEALGLPGASTAGPAAGPVAGIEV